MAYVAKRKNADGEITSYQVKWRLGGGFGPWQAERFEDETSAEVFKDAVNDHGQQWPPGWVPGQGYISPEAGAPDLRYRFDNYALESVRSRTGVEAHYKDAIEKELRTYLLPTFGTCDVRSTEHFSKRTVQAWVNLMAETFVWRGAQRKLMSPKTIKNLHGLLSSILKEAMQEEPPLRERNPCSLVRLPRTDDDGLEGDGSDEDMCFLEPSEVQAIVDELDLPKDKRLVRRKYATGLRWGELTALAKCHVFRDPKDGKAKIRVARAWKRKRGGGFYLGPPKSKRGRRTIRIDEITWDELQEDLEGLERNDLIHHNGTGDRLPYSTFYDRLRVATDRAHKKGTLPLEKTPTLHDFRHSHAAALLSAGRGLTYVQRRLGHQSITTTSDRYGHLLPQADDDAMEVLEEVLAGGRVGRVVPARAARRVYAVHAGPGAVVGFWDLEHAQQTAEQWALDRGQEARVEAWTPDWWVRTVGNGLKDVRKQVPDRVLVWEVGPAVYAADGTEQDAEPGVHEPRSRWVWEWEPGYTEELAEQRAGWRAGESVTEAAAWGLDREAVQAAYAAARGDALRVCALNPVANADGSGRRSVCEGG